MAMTRLQDHLDHWARRRPDAEFAVQGGRTLTWHQARQQVGRTASALVGLGLPVGARVGVLAGNSIEYLLLYYAAATAGVVPVPLNPRSAPPEHRYILEDAGVGLVLADAVRVAAVDALRAQLPGVRRFVTLDGAVFPGWDSLPALAASAGAAPPRPIRADDDLCQLYTSGTTGRPKGAMLTHRAVTANCAQIAALPHRGEPGERSLVAAPLCHAGAVWSTFAPQSWGAAAYVMAGTEPAELVRVLDEERIGYAALVPSMLQMCLTTVPDVTERSYPHLRMILTGSAPIAKPTLRRAIEVFGCDVIVGYGMTEASAGTSAMAPDDTRRGLAERPELLGCVGRPLPDTEVRIVDRAGGPLPLGEVGEIVVRGPQLMRGYWRKPEATAEALRGGWLHAGDAGYLDAEGYLYIRDRLTDLIISGGENVYPRMVEDVLHAHPAVAEAAVIGVPHERWGETVVAVVVPRAGVVIEEAELVEFCRGRLGGHQRPRHIEFVDALPRTPTGKVSKRALREPYWADRDVQVAGA